MIDCNQMAFCPGDFFTDRGNWLCSAYQQPRRVRGTVTGETGDM